MFSKYLRVSLVLLCLLAFTFPSNAQAAPRAIAPSPGAPLCPTHNDKQYHELWDAARGCHYDHTHDDNPASANSIFGPAGGLWGGQSISYPWMTPNENDGHGHQGYKFYVNLNPQPNCAAEGYDYLGQVNCVSAFRIEYHDTGGNAHLVKRFHSYYMEVQIKKGSTTGTIQTGGWADFGCMHETYKTKFLPLPGTDPVLANGQTACGSPGGQTIHADPYRAPKNTWQQIQGKTKGDNMFIWTSHNRYGYNNLGFFFYRTLDSWGSIDPAKPSEEHFLCPDFTCKFNDSEHHVFNVIVNIPASLANKNGIVNYTGYTDLKGNIVKSCTAPGPNCVPLKIVNAPVGAAVWSRNTSGPRPAGETIRDHDIYFNGQPSGWIHFLGANMSMPNPAPTTSAPTQTPVVAATSTVSTKPTTAPTSPPDAQIIPPAVLKTESGATDGSFSSLGSLNQSGADDNPNEYVTFQTPGSSVYTGYLAFNVPTNISAASVSEVSLLVNFQGAATSEQNWIWSIYDWDKKDWLQLGSASGTQAQWQMLKFSIPMAKQYVSAQGEIGIQLRSNNENGDAKIDYQVLQLK